MVLMGGPSPGSTYVSVQMSIEEKAVLDAAVKASGMNRNAFLRAFIATLRPDNPKKK
jgi:hypothetical protein